MKPVLQVNGLSKSYWEWGSEWLRLAHWLGFPTKPEREQVILDGINLIVGEGESIGILGKNGAGKSTLLKIITGTLSATDGIVARNGTISSILELGMGFQSELTGRENSYQIAGLMGKSRLEIDSVIASIEDFADIGDAFDHPVRTYSSGMQARVAFSVATAFRPSLLIIDEALSVGDAFFQAKCYERISKYRKEGMAVLLVSHSVADIVRNCDKAVLISEGRIKLEGHPRDVTNVYLEELFGRTERSGKKSPALNSDLSYQEDSKLAGIFEERPLYRKEEYRWGNGLARITDFQVEAGGMKYPAQIECGELVKVSFRCEFDEDFENVVPGLMVKTLDGVFAYGTNSLVVNEGARRIPVSRGDHRIFEYSLPFRLNEGNYLISIGVASGDSTETLEPLDRRYDSILVSCTRKVGFTGMVDLEATLNIC